MPTKIEYIIESPTKAYDVGNGNRTRTGDLRFFQLRRQGCVQ